MATHLPSSRSGTLRPALLAALGIVVVGTAGALFLYNRAPEPSMAGAPAPVAAPSAQQPAVPGLPKPSFDIVRVNPKGDAVMAGRAAPGAKVIIAEDGKEIGQAQADQHGDWVFVPPAQLTPGARNLTLTERTPDGAEVKGDRSVVLVVPEITAGAKSAQQTPALAVLTGPNTAPSVLTGPAPAGASAGASRLAIGAAEYGDQDKLRLGGTAPPGATVRVYLDDKPIGQAVAGSDGKWGLSNSAGLAPGEHHVRVDQVAPDGSVTARVEQDFSRTQLELAAGHIVIASGQNLWTIARRAYGQGTRYLVIFQANRHAIRDPNLIYPGQVFTLPSSSVAPATPASSSTSR